MRARLLTLIAPLAIVAAACGRTSPAPEGSPAESPAAGAPAGAPGSGASAGDSGSDSALVARLEAEARTIAHGGPCASPQQCATAPVGERACGGPRDYIVYCRAVTDSVALFAKLGELARAEQAWNAKRGAMGTCEFRMPPATELAGQQCRPAAIR